MAYKSKTYNFDIHAPSGSGELWIQTGGVWSLSVTDSLGTGSGAFSAIRNYKTRGYNTDPGWKAFRAANGYLPTRQMTETHYSHDQLGINSNSFYGYRSDGRPMKYLFKGGFKMQATDMFQEGRPGFLDSQSKMDKVIISAEQKALSKAKDMKVNVGVALAEGRQTVRMIRDTARRLGKSYHAFRRGRFKEAAKHLGIKKPTGTAANDWLAYNLGWTPLISDVKGLAELAAQELELGGRAHRFIVRGKQTEASAPISFISATNHGTYAFAGDYLIEASWSYEGRAWLLVELKYQPAAFASQLGFGLTDPALIAWELVPFSFVFDWFVDVGSYLESASSLQGLIVKDGGRSIKQTVFGTQRLVSPRSYTIHLFDRSDKTPVMPIKDTYFLRWPWTGAPSTIRTPLWDGLNAHRLTTSAALFRQLCIGDRTDGTYPKLKSRWR